MRDMPWFGHGSLITQNHEWNTATVEGYPDDMKLEIVGQGVNRRVFIDGKDMTQSIINMDITLDATEPPRARIEFWLEDYQFRTENEPSSSDTPEQHHQRVTQGRKKRFTPGEPLTADFLNNLTGKE